MIIKSALSRLILQSHYTSFSVHNNKPNKTNTKHTHHIITPYDITQPNPTRHNVLKTLQSYILPDRAKQHKHTQPNTLYYTRQATARLPAPTPQRATKFTLHHNSPHHSAAATTPPPHSAPRPATRVDTQQYTQPHFLTPRPPRSSFTLFLPSP